MKLEEGMYIRYTRGVINGYVPPRIAKIIDCSDKDLIKIDNGQIILRNDILKSSKNIIDLIEEGDYVNGYKIDYINLNCETPFLRSNQPYRVDNTLYSTLIEKGKDYNQPLHFYEEDIKSIVTKEQFESMAYEVEQ